MRRHPTRANIYAENAGQNAHEELSIAPAEEALRAVARRWRWCLTVCLLASGVAVAVAIRFSQTTYRVEGKLVYHLSKTTSPDFESMPLQNFATLLKSPGILAALRDKSMDSMATNEDLRDVEERIQYEIPLAGTVLDVRFHWNDPNQAVAILNRLMDLLLQESRDHRTTMLEQHVSRCREDLQVADKQLLAYQQSAAKSTAMPSVQPLPGSSTASELAQLSSFLHGQLTQQQLESQSAVRLRVRQEEYARAQVLFAKSLISEAELKKAEGELEIERAHQNEAVRVLKDRLKLIDGSLAGSLVHPGVVGALSIDGKAVSQELISTVTERQRLWGKLAKLEEAQRSKIDELIVFKPATQAINGVRSNATKLFLLTFGGVLTVLLLPVFLLELRRSSRRLTRAAQGGNNSTILWLGGRHRPQRPTSVRIASRRCLTAAPGKAHPAGIDVGPSLPVKIPSKASGRPPAMGPSSQSLARLLQRRHFRTPSAPLFNRRPS